MKVGMTKAEWIEAKKLHQGTIKFIAGPHSGPNRHERRRAKHHPQPTKMKPVEITGPVEIVKPRETAKRGLFHRAVSVVRRVFGGRAK